MFCQHAGTFLLVVIHASPVLNDHHGWALVAGSAGAAVVCDVAFASSGVAGVVV